MKIFAQGLENPVLKDSVKNLEGVDFFNRALPFLIHWLIIVGFFFFLVHFLLGGLKWINSQGEKNKIEEAQKQLTFALVGLLVVFSIFAIIRIIGFVFGLSGFENLQITLPQL